VKSKFGKKKKLSEDMSLQITSMADIFMILLVFLLKSYSTSLTNMSPSQGVKLPVAESSGVIKDTLKLEISASAITVDNNAVVTMNAFNIRPASQLNDAGIPMKLYKVLFDERKRHPVPNMDTNLLVMADEHTPYSVLKAVLATAAGAGFVDLQLVVVEAN
jgi:biopolymer transport protein ExbD